MKSKSAFEGLTNNKRKFYLFFFRIIKRKKQIVIVNLLLTAFSSFLIVIPNRIQEIALNLLTNGILSSSLLYGVLFCLMSIVGDIVDVIRNYTSQKMAKELSLCAQLEASDYIQKLPLSSLSVTSASEMMMHQMDVMGNVGNLALAAMNIIVLVLTSITAFYFAFQIDPIMTLLAFLIVEPIRIIITKRSAKTISELNSEQQVFSKKVWQILTENFQYFYYIKAQNLWQWRRRKTEESMQKEKEAACIISKERSRFSFVSFFLANLIIGFVFIRSIIRVYYGNITFGQLTVIISYFSLLQGRLSYTVTSILNFITEKKKFDERLVFYTQKTEKYEIGDRITSINKIEISHITFSFDNTNKIIAYNFDFNFFKGEFVAIKGNNGCGKTTFINLLLGLFSPASGKIIINGIPISNLSMDSYRSNIGYLPQNPVVFTDTICSNLYIKEQDDELCFDNYTNILDIDIWIEKFSKKNDTYIDNPSQTLSGGERQRLALARVFSEEKSVYILDEPTSALDEQTKVKLIKIIQEKKQNSIFIVISHDNMLLDCADRVIEIKEEQNILETSEI